MGRFVIVAYRPKAGRERELAQLVERHLQVLASEQLITDHPGSVMRAADGTLVEVFEWRSDAAVDAAHTNATVGSLWAEFAAVCDYVPLSTLPETQQLFAEFAAPDAG